MELELVKLTGEKFFGLPVGILIGRLRVLIVPEEPEHCNCSYCKTGRYYKLKEKIMKGEIRFPTLKESIDELRRM